MHHTITKKINLLLLLPATGILAVLTFFYWVHTETQNDTAFLHVASSQSMLSQQLLIYSHMVHMGQDEDRGFLYKTINEFEHMLKGIEYGGSNILSYDLDPIPLEIREELGKVKKVWLKLKPSLLKVVKLPYHTSDARNSYIFIEENIESLTKASTQLVKAYEERSTRLKNWMFYSLIIVTVLTLLSFFTTMWIIRRYSEERKSAESRLRESEERFSLAVSGTNDGIWDWDLLSGVIYFSPRWKQMLGYTDEEIENTFSAFQSLFHKEDLGMALEIWIAAMEGSASKFSVEYRLKDKQGEYHWIQCRGIVLKGKNDEPVRMAGSHTDITERKQAEETLHREKQVQQELIEKIAQVNEQLLQADKMASIGQLAAGVAHEINNPVGYINSNLSSLKQYMGDLLKVIEVYEQSEELISDAGQQQVIRAMKQQVDLEFLRQDLKELLQESEEGVKRVKQIVQDLKDFSHVDEAQWQWANLHKGLDSTLNIVRNELKYKADVIKDYGEVPQVECIISQLNQVFMNLLVNAAHAIGGHGTITIRTGTQDNGVWVEIEDTGKGMNVETQRKIFDPFFTTKPVGQGTGLGLSLSYGIVQKHKGRISVRSELGKGTQFHIWLPIEQQQQRAVS